MTTAEHVQQSVVYYRAAEIITERGWNKKGTYGRGGKVDVCAALGLAERELGYPVTLPPTTEFFAEHVGMGAAEWNDHPDIDGDDAVGMLNEVGDEAAAIEAVAAPSPAPRRSKARKKANA